MYRRFLTVLPGLPVITKRGRLLHSYTRCDSECCSFSRNVATAFTDGVRAISMRMSRPFIAQRDNSPFSMFFVSPFNQGTGVVQSVLWLEDQAGEELCPQNVQTGSGAHKACYSVGWKGYFSLSKAPRPEIENTSV